MVERAIELSQKQESAGVAPVLTLKHLAVQADVPLSLLENVSSRTQDPYHIHAIRKRNQTSKRMIAAPSDDLRRVQRWMLDNIFSRVPVSEHACAYISGRSAAQCARQHLGSRWLVKLDVKDFFHEFDEAQVFNVVRELHYTPLVSLELARIATRHPTTPQRWLPKKYSAISRRRPTQAIDVRDVFDSGTTPDVEHLSHSQGLRLGYLPQGAPSSGALSNILSRSLDADLAALASSAHLSFTRYADDIVLSSSAPYARSKAEKIVNVAMQLLSQNGLTANRSKTRVIAPGRPLQVLGVRVDDDETRLSKRTRSRIEYHLAGVERFGFAAHSAHAGFHDPLGFENFLYGLIRYAHDVEPQRAASYFDRADSANPGASLRGRSPNHRVVEYQ